MKVSNSYVGRPMERVEDMRFLRGRGTYVADVNCLGQLHAVILRSSVAHGIIKSLDTTRARAMPGVRHVLAAADFGAAVPRIPLRLQPLPQLEPFHQPVLADGKVRYVGEPIAIVLADTQGIAEDALRSRAMPMPRSRPRIMSAERSSPFNATPRCSWSLAALSPNGTLAKAS